jgi:hypothetical protein
MLSDIAHCNVLFHTAAGTAFADILIEGHQETWPIRSKRFRAFLKRRYSIRLMSSDGSDGRRAEQTVLTTPTVLTQKRVLANIQFSGRHGSSHRSRYWSTNEKRSATTVLSHTSRLPSPQPKSTLIEALSCSLRPARH